MSDLSKLANYIVLREQGKTYQEIADMFGVSKQSVQQTISNAERKVGGRIRKNNADIEKIAYKGLYELFLNDTTMTVSKLSRAVYGNASNKNRSKIDRLLQGENARVTIMELKNLIEFTGMPFEELFEPRGKDGEQE